MNLPFGVPDFNETEPLSDLHQFDGRSFGQNPSDFWVKTGVFDQGYRVLKYQVFFFCVHNFQSSDQSVFGVTVFDLAGYT